MAKCYIICCAICGCLHGTSRRDALTCSSKCLVWSHRHPETLSKLRKQCERFDVEPFMALQAQAIQKLRPDLGPRIMSGDATLDDVQPEVAQTLWKRAETAVMRADKENRGLE
jgi:hypothetical protein